MCTDALPQSACPRIECECYARFSFIWHRIASGVLSSGSENSDAGDLYMMLVGDERAHNPWLDAVGSSPRARRRTPPGSIDKNTPQKRPCLSPAAATLASRNLYRLHAVAVPRRLAAPRTSTPVMMRHGNSVPAAQRRRILGSRAGTHHGRPSQPFTACARALPRRSHSGHEANTMR